MAARKLGHVHKSPDGWARFQARTEAGKRKRPAVMTMRDYRPAKVGR